MTRSEEALRLMAEHGITAKEAAKRVGISPAAVSKAKRHPSTISQLRREISIYRGQLRCPNCNYEFPHHWAGCMETRALPLGQIDIGEL